MRKKFFATVVSLLFVSVFASVCLAYVPANRRNNGGILEKALFGGLAGATFGGLASFFDSRSKEKKKKEEEKHEQEKKKEENK